MAEEALDLCPRGTLSHGTSVAKLQSCPRVCLLCTATGFLSTCVDSAELAFVPTWVICRLHRLRAQTLFPFFVCIIFDIRHRDVGDGSVLTWNALSLLLVLHINFIHQLKNLERFD